MSVRLPRKGQKTQEIQRRRKRSCLPGKEIWDIFMEAGLTVWSQFVCSDEEVGILGTGLVSTKAESKKLSRRGVLGSLYLKHFA